MGRIPALMSVNSPTEVSLMLPEDAAQGMKPPRLEVYIHITDYRHPGQPFYLKMV
jgi:hypothetical protein